MDLDDDQSSASSSSSSSCDISRANSNGTPFSENDHHQPSLSRHKKKTGRKKFKETRHPIYHGVRQRNGNKWVCEVREPNKKSRIWLGTFPTPEMAARAHDVAALALRGESVALNFHDSIWRLPRAQSSAPVDIQKAAFKAVKIVWPCSKNLTKYSPTTKNLLHEVPASSSLTDSLIGKDKENPQENSSNDEDISVLTFLDEEAIFNMPGLLVSMAEGMLLTPPTINKGFNWDDDIDVTLWMMD